jgi:hypothetical protein
MDGALERPLRSADLDRLELAELGRSRAATI